MESKKGREDKSISKKLVESVKFNYEEIERVSEQ